MSKELANALRAVASAESRAAVAEVHVFVCSLLYTLFFSKSSQMVKINFKLYTQAKLSGLQRKMGSTDDKVCFCDWFC